MRRHRPRRRAAQQRYELASLYLTELHAANPSLYGTAANGIVHIVATLSFEFMIVPSSQTTAAAGSLDRNVGLSTFARF
jgi:hypothetical protein